MANLWEFNDEKQKEWDTWLASRPQIIKDLAKRFPPNKLYLLKTSNHRVTMRSYVEDGTITVNVSGDFNNVMFDRGVFGIKPEDLEECDLPKPEESLGTFLTKQKDVENFCDAVRPIILTK
jgi:hypothetical protein